MAIEPGFETASQQHQRMLNKDLTRFVQSLLEKAKIEQVKKGIASIVASW